MKDIFENIKIGLSVFFAVQLFMQFVFWIVYGSIMFIAWEPMQVNWGIMRLMVVLGTVVFALGGMFAYADKDNF